MRAGVLGRGQILAWSADSRFLVVATSPAAEEPVVLTAVDIATGATRPVTKPSSGFDTDLLPSISPDGRTLAFVRQGRGLTDWGNCTSRHCRPASSPLESLDSSAGKTGVLSRRRLECDRTRPDRVVRQLRQCRVVEGSTAASRAAGTPVTVRRRMPPARGRRAAGAPGLHTRELGREHVAHDVVGSRGSAAGAPVRVIGSTRSELNAQFSPDGSRIVFESMRSGHQELWVADQDGRNALRLTSFNGRLGGTPAWSPDGQSVAFDLRNEDGRGDVYVIPARGGAAVRLTDDPADDLVPSWSRDGQSIYFGSTRTGRYEIWKMSARGGNPIQVTHNGGTYAKESIDRKYIYYGKSAPSAGTGLWRVAVGGRRRSGSRATSRQLWQLRRRVGRTLLRSTGCRGIRWPILRISLRSPVWRGRSTFSALLLERSVASSLSIGIPGMASTCLLTSEHCCSRRWMPSPKI